MIDNLNLASRPFRNRTLPWAVAIAVSIVSLLAFVFFISEGRQAQAKAEAVERDVISLRAENDALHKKAEEVAQSLTPEQKQTLEAAHLIIDRKNFSWSRLLADLEASLPQGVRVSRISVRGIKESGGRTVADLDLTVIGHTTADITSMINDMDRSGLFSANLLTENAKADKTEPGIESTLRVTYTPDASRHPLSTNDNARLASTTETQTPALAEAR